MQSFQLEDDSLPTPTPTADAAALPKPNAARATPPARGMAESPLKSNLALAQQPVRTKLLRNCFAVRKRSRGPLLRNNTCCRILFSVALSLQSVFATPCQVAAHATHMAWRHACGAKPSAFR